MPNITRFSACPPTASAIPAITSSGRATGSANGRAAWPRATAMTPRAAISATCIPPLAAQARWRFSGVTRNEIAQDTLGRMHLRRAAHGDQLIGGLGREITLVPIDADARLEPGSIGLGVKLRRVDIRAMPHHLIGAGWRGDQMHAALWQILQRLLVTHERGKTTGDTLQQRIVRGTGRDVAIGSAHRLAIRALGDIAAQMLTEDADPVATAEKRYILAGDARHQRQHGGLDPGLLRGLVVGRVADAAGAAADDHPGILGQPQVVGQILLIQPDTMGLRRLQPTLAQDRGIFVIRRLGFGAQLQDEKGLGHGASPRAVHWLPCNARAVKPPPWRRRPPG